MYDKHSVILNYEYNHVMDTVHVVFRGTLLEYCVSLSSTMHTV